MQNCGITLNAKRTELNTLHTRRVITDEQKELLFPQAGMPPTTSNKYDITLLYVLLRTIYGLTAPASTGSFIINPPSADESPEAALVRIKYYRNILAHRNNTEVSDVDFNTYWSDISDALVRLGADMGDIAELKSKPIDEDDIHIDQLNEWDENKENILHKVLLQTEAIRLIAEENAANTEYIMAGLRITLILLGIILVFIVCGLTILSFIQFWKERDHSYPHNLSHPQNFSYFQNFSNPGFVGREWIFRKLENILSTTGVRGVQLIADPGWGKSAIMKRLIHSSSSSTVIHENIIGYHFCEYDEKSTRDGKQFVKNLVKLIGEKIPELQVQSNCEEKPMKCFEKAILEPLKKINDAKRKTSFILIDALDECLEKEDGHQSIIVNILNRRVHDLPTWVKLIVTSRNQTLTSGKISKNKAFSTLNINVEDQRNEQDLRTYAEQTLQNFSTETSSMKDVLRIKHLLHLVLKFSKGNFLFLETIIKHWQKYPDRMNVQNIPESLGDIYATSFSERYKDGDISDFEPLLEALLAAKSPPTLSELGEILNYYDKKYNTLKVANKLSEYFKSDINQGPLEFHHQFFAEWLINQTHATNGIVIQKSRGHQYIVDYLFHFYSERQTNLTYEELTELCMHILDGEKASLSNRYTRKLTSLKVSEVRDRRKKTILHDPATRRDATGLIDVLVKQFKYVDILDFEAWTPAMYAVEAGSYENVKLFIDNGANVSYTVETRFCFYFTFIAPFKYFDTRSSMSSIAAYRGYTKIAELLIKSGVKVEKENECGWKPLHLAAVMGHFEMVQLYINKGAQPDLISLHHAAARNHTEIVRLLFNTTRVRDECLPCKPGNKSWCRMNLNQFHHCYCETALHAAVSRNNLEMAKLIVRYGNASVNCKHGSGLTPLMEAFYRKNTQMVELLISAGADINAECESLILDFIYDCHVLNFITVEKSIYTHYCNRLVCNGSGVIDFSFAHGLWEMIIPFISKGKLNPSSNNIRWSPTTIAVIYDRVDFIRNATFAKTRRIFSQRRSLLEYKRSKG